MELKHPIRLLIAYKVYTFNRTSMELKLPPHRRASSMSGPFNRTSMELKLTLGFHIVILVAYLLIEPVWN